MSDSQKTERKVKKDMKKTVIVALLCVAQMSALDLQTALGTLTTSLNDLRDALAGSKKNVSQVTVEQLVQKQLDLDQKFEDITIQHLLPVYKLINEMELARTKITPEKKKNLADLIAKMRNPLTEINQEQEALFADFEKHTALKPFSAYLLKQRPNPQVEDDFIKITKQIAIRKEAEHRDIFNSDNDKTYVLKTLPDRFQALKERFKAIHEAEKNK